MLMNFFSNKPMADTKKEHEVVNKLSIKTADTKKEHEIVNKLSIITWTKLSVKLTERN